MPDTLAPLTHKRVVLIAAPIVLSGATVPILGAVDTGVIGQLGDAAMIGAVGIGSIILTAIYWIFGFLRMGTVGLTSQALGAGRMGEVAVMLTRTLLIGGAGGLIVIALQTLIFNGALRLAPASAEVEVLARDYMTIRVWSAPAIISLYGVTGWLIAQERTRAVLLLQLVMNGLNIGLDLWFVLDLGFGIQGVAWASFIAEWSGLILGLWLCRDAFAAPAARAWSQVFDKKSLKQLAMVNRDILLRSLMLQSVFTSFLFLGGNFSDATLASNQVLMQFMYITSYALDGFAAAAETLIGQAFGARNAARVRRSAVMSSQWGLGSVILLSAGFAIWGGPIIDIMAKIPEVQAEARIFLIYMVLAPLIGVMAWMLDGIFIGAARARDMRNMMAISLIIYVASLLILVPSFGNHGLWLSLLISFAARGITLGLRYPALEAAAR